MTRRTLRRSVTSAPASRADAARAVRTAIPQMVRVALVWRLAGGVLMVTATTLKRGTTYHDAWSISPSLALVSVTVKDGSAPRRTSYVSRAAVAGSALAPDTTYTFSYAIVMRAGERAWVGSGSVIVTVGADGSLPELDRRAYTTRTPR